MSLNGNHVTLMTAEAYQFVTDDKQLLVGLRVVLKGGQTVTMPFSAAEAEHVGSALIAHADMLNGKPPREVSEAPPLVEVLVAR